MLVDALPSDSFDVTEEEKDCTTPTGTENGSVAPIQQDENNRMVALDVSGELREAGDIAKRSSFDLINLRSRLYDFDEKYRNDGRYAASFPETMNGPRPGKIEATAASELPKIGPLLASSDDSSEDMEEMMSNGESMYSHTILYLQS